MSKRSCGSSALALLIIALARPQWGETKQSVAQKGVQVMVALDVSKSMLAQDLKPDRLTRAKMEINELMNHLNGDEVGLTVFSGASFVLFPLTSDYNTARSFLDSAHPGIISRPGTAIGEALHTAMRGFDDARNSQKVIVVMTDGEDNQADVEAAAQEAAKAGVMVYTIGFGSSTGDVIPEYDAAGNQVGVKKDKSGQTVVSTLNEQALRDIAATTGGAILSRRRRRQRTGRAGGAVERPAKRRHSAQRYRAAQRTVPVVSGPGAADVDRG